MKATLYKMYNTNTRYIFFLKKGTRLEDISFLFYEPLKKREHI